MLYGYYYTWIRHKEKPVEAEIYSGSCFIKSKKDKLEEALTEQIQENVEHYKNKISTDIDPPPKIYSLINILKEIPLSKQYIDSLQAEQTQKQKPTGCLSPDIVLQIKRKILGMEK